MPKQLPPRLPFDVPDYLVRTPHLTIAEHGGLMMLYFAYWMNQGPLLSNRSHLAKLARMAVISDDILNFFEDDGTHLHCSWLDQAIKTTRSLRKKQQKGAEQTNLTRWGSDSVSDSLNDPDCRAPWMKAFEEEFWPIYPKKVDKQGSMKAFKRAVQVDKHQVSAILEGLRAWLEDEQWNRDNGKFIPYPKTWINAHRWEAKTGENAQKVAESVGKTVIISGMKFSQSIGPVRSQFSDESEFNIANREWQRWCSRN